MTFTPHFLPDTDPTSRAVNWLGRSTAAEFRHLSELFATSDSIYSSTTVGTGGHVVAALTIPKAENYQIELWAWAGCEWSCTASVDFKLRLEYGDRVLAEAKLVGIDTAGSDCVWLSTVFDPPADASFRLRVHHVAGDDRMGFWNRGIRANYVRLK